MSDAIWAALGVAFAALCVWLGVRIFNRRERWAKRTAVIVLVPILYVASFGPACWISCRIQPSGKVMSVVYWPLIAAFPYLPLRIKKIAAAYMTLGMGMRSVVVNNCIFFPQ